ncbi:hypothetical protein JW835_09965 [bacterium]|nr:hypothetical protein [bacterium]
MSTSRKKFEWICPLWRQLFFLIIFLLPYTLFGYLVDLSITPQIRVVAQAGYHIFEFTTTASIPADGRIAIVYHPDFILTGVTSASSSTMDGSFTISLSGSTVILTRTGGTATSPGPENIQISSVCNPTKSDSYYYTLRTEDSGGSQIEYGSVPDFIYAGPLHHFSFYGVPATANAGSAIPSDIVVTARDQYNNRKSNYSSSIDWYTSDTNPSATVPTDDGTGWTYGQKTFSAADFIFYTKGTQTLRVEDGSISNTTANIDVESGPATDFILSCSTPQTVGMAFSLNVANAVDEWGNSFTGNVNIDVFSGGGNSPGGDPPTIPAQISVNDGSGSESGIILTNAVTTQFRGTSSGTVRYTSPITVYHASLVDFTLSASSPVTAGLSFTLNVTNAVDSYDNPWSGTISVDASQGGGNAPDGTPPSLNDISVTQGAGNSQQILTDTENTILRGQSGGIIRKTISLLVNPGALYAFNLSGEPSSVTAGEAFSSGIVLIAYDAFGNIKTNYNGSVFFESSDPHAQLFYDSANPYTGPYSSGSVTLAGSNFELRTAGSFFITVVDEGPNPDVSESSAAILVNTAEIEDFTLSCANTQIAGQSFPLYITNAHDSYNNAWSGMVSITASQGAGNSSNGAQPVFNDIYVSYGTGQANQILVLAESGVSLQAQAESVIRTKGNITVTYGDLARLKIRDSGGGVGNEVTTLSMIAGQSITFYSAGYDFYGNFRQDEFCDWSSSGTLTPQINVSNVSNVSFVPTAPGYGDISATAVSNASVSDNTGTLTVASGNLDHFSFDFVPTQIQNEPGQIRVTARDASNNVVSSFTGSVHLTDLTGTVQPTQPGPFESGVWIGNITVKQVFQNNRLTVQATTGESGQSNLFDVVEGPGSRIIQFQTLQADTTRILTTITTNQERDWYVKMGVENNGSVTLRLDSVRLELKVNGIVQSDYTIQYPTTFWEGGATLLTGGSIDSLLIKVDVTGKTSGPMTLEGSIYLVDTDTGNPLSPNDVTTSLTVQKPAVLSIPEIRLSRNEVTRGQQVPWFVTLIVYNSGESEILVDSDIARTGISFGIGNNWMIGWPENMAGGDWYLGGKEIDSLLYSIAQTGTGELGNCPIQAFLEGEELNTGRTLNLNVAAGKTVLIEEPPSFRIISVHNMSENSPRVNKGETVPIAIQVENSGGDAIIDASLNFQSAGGSILPPLLMLGNISGGQQKEANTEIIAGSVPTQSEIIVISGAGIADNTRFPLASVDPMDDSCLVVIQNPAKFEVVSVRPTETQLLGGRVDEWKVKVVVRNPNTNPGQGQGNLILQSPNSTDIRFFIDDQLQEDYTVIAPVQLSGGGLILRGGMTDTLTYRITATGRQGGDVIVRAELSGIDENKSSRQLNASGTANISVTAEKKLRIISTKVEAVHMVSDVAYVNTNQTFNIIVKVENGLGQSVENVRVRLSQNGQSTIEDSVYRWIPSLSPSKSATVQFQLTASPNPLLSGEKFVSMIKSAAYRLSGNSVNPGPPIDSTANVIIQSPAELKIQLSSPLDTYSTGQIFSFTAEVQNLGDADIDNSGILKVYPPAQYSLVSSDTLHLKSNDRVTWQIRAPSNALSPQAFTISWYYKPRDVNTNSEALISSDPTEPFFITTVNSYISTSLEIASPEGARDDTLSTDQFFTVQAMISWGNARDIHATLQLPEGYIEHSQLRQPVNFESSTQRDTVSWLVQAPNVTSDLALIQVNTYGVDAIQTSVPVAGFPVMPIEVTTVSKAALKLYMEITDPIDAADGSLSPGSVFTIQATVTNTGEADTLGSAMVSIRPLPRGYSTPDGVLEKPVQDGIVSWEIIAPSISSISASKIEGRFFQLPLDENTNNPAHVLQNQGSYSIAVNTESYLLKVVQDSLSGAASSVVPGQNNVKMMTLKFDNKSLRGGNKVTVDALRFDIEDRFGNPITNPQSVISRACVVNEEDPEEFFGIAEDISSENPVVVLFSRLLLVSVDGDPKVSIFVDIKEGVNVRYFRLNLKNSGYISAKDSESAYPVPVIGENEEEWASMRSDAKYIYNPETESNLWSCPNPFSEQTTIYYHLSESGDVNFKIFTLVGDLVWSYSLKDVASGPQTLTWDGCNDKGRRVMNGVYWLFMQTDAGVEGKFKIAVVK